MKYYVRKQRDWLELFKECEADDEFIFITEISGDENFTYRISGPQFASDVEETEVFEPGTPTSASLYEEVEQIIVDTNTRALAISKDCKPLEPFWEVGYCLAFSSIYSGTCAFDDCLINFFILITKIRPDMIIGKVIWVGENALLVEDVGLDDEWLNKEQYYYLGKEKFEQIHSLVTGATQKIYNLIKGELPT